jgi:hypothetical protein
MWNFALAKKVKLEHASSRNSVGGLVKVGKLWVLAGEWLFDPGFT